ncbi:shikimate dehydrogenase [Heliorestis acidaminivorans]|uniref:Shikimate dehydrogenase (NADP(+)) n=1 Tax=Heliorestis acidaminivorans TaxID=553427 RepID=A0A6I0EUD7_9FIRM|nr:shikimate dehydrogenase [Heliorestis acidaminivorans]KAB2951303.1 shikimate dehydrogenase [Heliorestis acidaminivorans]
MINGTTQWIALLGYPVAHTFSPKMQNAAIDHLGINWRYAAYPVHPDNLEKALQGLKVLGYKGLNITVPHKEKILPYLDEIDPLAAAIGAVNCVTIEEEGLKGYNTDAIGFIRGLREDNFEPQGRKVLILGAGGAARAAALALLQAGVTEITLANRSTEKAEELLQNLAPTTSLTAPVLRHIPFQSSALQEALDDKDLLVNATSLGMSKDGLITPYPLAPENWLPHKADLYVADMVYNPVETELLQAAKKRRQRNQNGLPMLLYQGAVALEKWTGLPAPVAVMAKALQEFTHGKK